MKPICKLKRPMSGGIKQVRRRRLKPTLQARARATSDLWGHRALRPWLLPI